MEIPLTGSPAFVAQRIEHLTTDQKVGGSSPSKRTGNSHIPQQAKVGTIQSDQTPLGEEAKDY
jgi:hypothetical protein